MATFATKSANIRMANEEGKRICTLHQQRGALESVKRMELTQVTHNVLFSA